MRNYSFLLLIVICLLSACGVYYPNSVRGTDYSTNTGTPYILTSFYPNYNIGGFEESELVNWEKVEWVDKLNLSKEQRKAETEASLKALNTVTVERSLADMPTNFAPGGILVYSLQLFADETEVANIHWQEFLYHMKRDSTEAFYKSMLPDTTVIELDERDYFSYKPFGILMIGTDTLKQIMPVFKGYLNHPEYLYYPVVGVNYEQAVAYCRWRSKVVTEQYNANPKNKQKLKVTYRLPTEQEWEVIAAGGHDKYKYPNGSASHATIKYKVNPNAAAFLAKKIVDLKPVAQIVQDLKETEVHDLPINVKRSIPYFLQFRTPAYVYGGIPNDYGAYHVLGNVAEMVAEKGIAKGGSWKDELSNSKITDRQLYTEPSDKVGFRCVCEAELLK